MNILTSPENLKPRLWVIRVARMLALASVCLFAGTAAHAEYAVMRSGARFHITGYEVSGAIVRLHLAGGAVILVCRCIST